MQISRIVSNRHIHVLIKSIWLVWLCSAFIHVHVTFGILCVGVFLCVCMCCMDIFSVQKISNIIWIYALNILRIVLEKEIKSVILHHDAEKVHSYHCGTDTLKKILICAEWPPRYPFTILSLQASPLFLLTIREHSIREIFALFSCGLTGRGLKRISYNIIGLGGVFFSPERLNRLF